MEYTVTSKKLLSVQNLSLVLNDRVILRDVNTEIFETTQPGGPVHGQVVAFLAPSGMGKTQLFRCIAGLQEPTGGAVYVNEDKDPVRAGEVGVLAQDYPLDETRTVLGNLELAARLAGRKGSDATNAAKEKLARFNLWDVRKHYPCQLSGGQRQRVAYLQQILCSKHFLLMDEPFSGLDVLVKDQVAQQILEYAAQDVVNTIIITSHDIRTACAVADLVWLLGRDHGEDGPIPGARIQKAYNLKDLDLCWHPEITATPRFFEFVTMIEKEDFPKLS